MILQHHLYILSMKKSRQARQVLKMEFRQTQFPKYITHEEMHRWYVLRYIVKSIDFLYVMFC